MLVGSSSVAVGWLVHLGISAGFGVVLALVLPAGLGVGPRWAPVPAMASCCG
jgi:hypothetical protein